MIERGSWTEPVRAAVIQTRLYLSNVEENLRNSITLMEEADKGSNPDLMVLPEAFTTGFEFEKLPELAEKSDMVTGSMCDFARDHGTHIFFTQIVGDKGRLMNRSHHIGGDGTVKGTYDKTHLFSRIGEDEWISPGDRLVEYRMGDIRIGPLICYEIRYPELARKLTLEGVDLIIYMAQWPHFRIFQWETLLRARAIENQLFVIGVNIWGDHKGVMMGGGSRIISPFGEILAHLDDGPGWTSAEMDPSVIEGVRRKIPVFDDRIEKLY
ncbi:MAG: nitrilase-related carbon-nitrogen hydrolase [Thermoplasmatota archaeon]